MTSAGQIQFTPIFLAQQGFACFILDLEGHDRSDGLKAFVPNVDLVVQDCVSFFTSIIKHNANFQNLPNFLFGESMGGAICLLIHLQNRNFFNGVALIAPMGKISDKVKPKFPIPQILTALAKLLLTLLIVNVSNSSPSSRQFWSQPPKVMLSSALVGCPLNGSITIGINFDNTS